MKKLILILLLGINVASAEGLFKNFNQFQRACQNKISHFYTCKFINLRILERLNPIEKELIRGDFQGSRDVAMVLDTIHNKNIKNYLTQSGKQYINDMMRSINRDFPGMIDEIKNNPSNVYNVIVLKDLNDLMRQKGIELR